MTARRTASRSWGKDRARWPRDEHDRRRNVVALTRAGRAERRRLEAGVGAAQAALLAPLGAPDRAELRCLLTHVVLHHADARAGSAP